jgi:hypothetical protein
MFVRSAGLCLILTVLLSSAQAGVIVKVGDLTWNEGATGGFLDVFVRADTGTTVDLDNFGYEFQISPVALTASRMFFAATQTLSGLTSDSGYVFSTAGGNPFASSSSPFEFVGGGDFALTGPVTIGDTFRLMTRLELLPGAGALAPEAGDQFEVNLVSSVNTLFDDGSFNNAIGFTAEKGLITVRSSSSVVPEPSSALVALVLAGCGVIGIRLKKKLVAVQ